MSVPVGPDSIEQHVLGRPFAYVISMSTTGAHVVAVQVELWEGHLDCSRVGHSTRRNVVDNPTVTVVFPPARDYGDDEYGSYSLLVDGNAAFRDDRFVVEIRSAVLHRPA
ncbi:MAG: pyridoxamine 5'-phosphate oxidase family protein [Actinomycetota bacterium]